MTADNEKIKETALYKRSRISSILLCLLALHPVFMGFCNLFLYELCSLQTEDGANYLRNLAGFILLAIIGLAGLILVIREIWVKCREHKGSLLAYMGDKCRREPWWACLMLLLIWSLISALRSEYTFEAFLGSSVARDGWVSYCIYALFMVLAYFVRFKEHRRPFIRCFVFTSDILVALMAFREFDVPILERFSQHYSSSVFLHYNNYGYYLCVSLTLLAGLFCKQVYEQAALNNKTISGAGAIYMLSFVWQMYGLMINDTMGAFLGVAIAMTVMLIACVVRTKSLPYKALLPILATVLIVGLSAEGYICNVMGETIGDSFGQLKTDVETVVEAEDTDSDAYLYAGTGRMILWIEGLKVAEENPIFGVGPESLIGEYQEKLGLGKPHNEYIQWAAFCGFPALILYLGMLLTLCVNRLKNFKKLSLMSLAAMGAVVAYQISGFFGFTTYATTPYLYVMLGFVAAGVTGADADEESIPAKVTVDNRADLRALFRENKSAWLPALTAAFMFGIFIPLDTYLGNMDEYWFDIYDIAPIFICGFVILFISLSVTGILCARNPRAGRIWYLLLSVLIVCIYIQADFIEIPYGIINGEEIAWDAYGSDNFYSLLVWLAVIALMAALYYLKGFEKYSRVFNVLALCLVALQVFTSVVALVSMDGFRRSDNIYATTENEWVYSDVQNFNILVLDTYDSRVFSDYIMHDHEQEVSEHLSDFTYFRDTLGAYTLTDYALPQIITGQWYLGDVSYGDYVDDSYPESYLLNRLKSEDWSVNIYTDVALPQNEEGSSLIDNLDSVEYKVLSKYTLADELYKMALFKSATTIAKRFFVYSTDNLEYSHRIVSIGGEPVRANEKVNFDSGVSNWSNIGFKLNSECVDVSADQKTFHLYHLQGIHAARNLTIDYETIENEEDYLSLEEEAQVVNDIVYSWLEELKEKGVYDNSIIMIMGDHGANVYEAEDNFIQTPLLLIKGVGESHDFQITDLPLSYSDLDGIYAGLLDGRSAWEAANEALSDLALDIERFAPYTAHELKARAADESIYNEEVGRRRYLIFHMYDGALKGDATGTTGYELYTDYHAFNGKNIMATGNIY